MQGGPISLVPGGISLRAGAVRFICRRRRGLPFESPERRPKQKTPAARRLSVLAFPAGFEPTAFRLGGGRSILLSYGNIFLFAAFFKRQDSMCIVHQFAPIVKKRKAGKAAARLSQTPAAHNKIQRRFLAIKRILQKMIRFLAAQNGG